MSSSSDSPVYNMDQYDTLIVVSLAIIGTLLVASVVKNLIHRYFNPQIEAVDTPMFITLLLKHNPSFHLWTAIGKGFKGLSGSKHSSNDGDDDKPPKMVEVYPFDYHHHEEQASFSQIVSVELTPEKIAEFPPVVQPVLKWLPIHVGIKGGLARLCLKWHSGLRDSGKKACPWMAKEIEGVNDCDLVVLVPDTNTLEQNEKVAESYAGYRISEDFVLESADVQIKSNLNDYFNSPDITMNQVLIFRTHDGRLFLAYTKTAYNDCFYGIVRANLAAILPSVNVKWDFDEHNNCIVGEKVLVRMIMRYIKGHGKSYSIDKNTWEHYQKRKLTPSSAFYVLKKFDSKDDKFEFAYQHMKSLKVLPVFGDDEDTGHPAPVGAAEFWGRVLKEVNRNIAMRGTRLMMSPMNPTEAEEWWARKLQTSEEKVLRMEDKLAVKDYQLMSEKGIRYINPRWMEEESALFCSAQINSKSMDSGTTNSSEYVTVDTIPGMAELEKKAKMLKQEKAKKSLKVSPFSAGVFKKEDSVYGDPSSLNTVIGTTRQRCLLDAYRKVEGGGLEGSDDCFPHNEAPEEIFDKAPVSGWEALKTLFHQTASHRRILFLGVLFLTAGSLCNVTALVFFSSNGLTNAYLYGTFTALYMIGSFVGMWYLQTLARKIEYSVFSELFLNLLQRSRRWWGPYFRLSQVLGRMQADGKAVTTIWTNFFPTFVVNSIVLPLLFVAIIFIDWTVFLFAICFFGFVIALFLSFFVWFHRETKKLRRKVGRLYALAYEVIQSQKTLRRSNTTGIEVCIYRELFTSVQEVRFRLKMYQQWMNNLVRAIELCVIHATIYSLNSSSLSTSDQSIVTMLAYVVFTEVTALYRASSTYFANLGMIERVLELNNSACMDQHTFSTIQTRMQQYAKLKRQSPHKSDSGEKAASIFDETHGIYSTNGEIKLESVVYEDSNLQNNGSSEEISRKARVDLPDFVSRTGELNVWNVTDPALNSNILAMVLENTIHGDYALSSGRISLGGTSLSNYDSIVLREHIAFISAREKLMEFSLFDNITVGCIGCPFDEPSEASEGSECNTGALKKVSAKRFNTAVQMAGLEQHFVMDMELPNGYENINTSKMNLSEYTRLLVLLCRAYMRERIEVVMVVMPDSLRKCSRKDGSRGEMVNNTRRCCEYHHLMSVIDVMFVSEGKTAIAVVSKQ
eukprot:Nk52_evm3s2377 gene=Nk52_evmTU3s2377